MVTATYKGEMMSKVQEIIVASFVVGGVIWFNI